MNKYTETTTVGYGSRLKKSIVGFFLGILMIFGAVYLLGYNEGRYVDTRTGLNQGEESVVSINASSETSNQKGLVHVQGVVDGEGQLVDDVFGIESDALKLRRVVEMYQWTENTDTKKTDNFGGSETREVTYSYNSSWEERKVDSSNFRYKEAHINPTDWKFETMTYEKKNIKIGNILLDDTFIRKLDKTISLELSQFDVKSKDVDIELVPSENKLYVGGKNNVPQIGDLRVSFEVVEAGMVTAIGEHSDKLLSTHHTENGTNIALLSYGKLSSEEMFGKAHKTNSVITWGLRGLGILILYLGFSGMLAPLVILAKVVPFVSRIIGFGTGIIAFFLAISVGFITIAIAWFYARPIISVIIILIGVAIAGGVLYWKKQKSGKEQSA